MCLYRRPWKRNSGGRLASVPRITQPASKATAGRRAYALTAIYRQCRDGVRTRTKPRGRSDPTRRASSGVSTIEDLTHYLKIFNSTLYKLTRREELPEVKVSRH
jgi:hypothetical protein